MTNQARKHLWNYFYSQFFIILVVQYPQSINEQYLKKLKLFFQTASTEEIKELIKFYLNATNTNKYGEETNSSPYHIMHSNN